MKKVALIEIGKSHDECLYSQLAFLKEAGYWVSLICTQSLANQVKDFEVDELILLDLPEKGKLAKWAQLIRLRNYLIKGNFNKAIFNTASINNVRNLLLLPFPSSIEFCGIIHHIKKLTHSRSQKFISRKVKKYFVLNDHLLRKLEAEALNLRLSSFYPIFFQSYPSTSLFKPDGEIWICIPGQIVFKRRDYIKLLEALDKDTIKPELKFILLGRSDQKSGDGRVVRQMIYEKGMENNFILFDGFIQNSTFHAYLQESDYILPLTHSTTNGGSYLQDQVSGTFNLAFAYKKPLLCEDVFSSMEDFQENAIFYKLDELASFFQNLPSPNELNKQLYQHPKWSFPNQQQAYVNFIEQ